MNWFRREIPETQNIKDQHLGFDTSSLAPGENGKESCFMIEEESKSTSDRDNHRYLKLSPCKKVIQFRLIRLN